MARRLPGGLSADAVAISVFKYRLMQAPCLTFVSNVDLVACMVIEDL